MSLFSLKAERSAPLKPKRSLEHPISMAKVDWKNIEKQTATLAETLLNGFTKQAVADARDFQARAQNQIAEWLVDVANGDITKKNFESLVRGERDLAEMQALKQVGLGQVALDTFTKGFMEIVLNAALSAIP